MNKKGLEFSFAWLFAILAGAVIIFLAIYISMRFIKTGEYEVNTLTAKQLSIIFEPMETGAASGKSSLVSLNDETRIFNDCYDYGNFGRNQISLSVKQGFKKEWAEPGGRIDVTNKYIFSEDVEQGREIYFFSKPFNMPFKISEIIFLTSKKYCFVNAPGNIKDEVSGLNLKNIMLENCSANHNRVCFGASNCEISVIGMCSGYECENEFDYGEIIKGKESVTYAGSLLYAGIFSDKEIYECNVKRLMKKLSILALLYKDEADYISDKCGSSYTNLVLLANSAKSLKDSKDLLFLIDTAEKLEQENNAGECKIWA